MGSAYLGIDVGSVSTNLALIDSDNQLLARVYLRTDGEPIKAVRHGLAMLYKDPEATNHQIKGAATTGSGRELAAAIIGADCAKNEITAHAVAASHCVPGARTVIEIGGQDSKIIILRNGVLADFAMNTVCAAGTGSFLDQQALRLKIPIEQFGRLALAAKKPVRIAGRCSVFAESDMIHKQQIGYSQSDIIAGLCEALARNYLNNVAKGKKILAPIVFQGGVAANQGLKTAFENLLEANIIVPDNYDIMGAFGAAMLAKEAQRGTNRPTSYRGIDVITGNYNATGFECEHCANHCEIIEIELNGKLVARWGSRCERWQAAV